MMKLAVFMLLVATMVTVHAASLDSKSDLIKRLLDVLENKEEKRAQCNMDCGDYECANIGKGKEICLNKRNVFLIRASRILNEKRAKGCHSDCDYCVSIGQDGPNCLDKRMVPMLQENHEEK